MVVEPRRDIGVPNFIVVDQVSKVQGQVSYKKKFNFRPEMCSHCYTEGHFKKTSYCKGVRSWNEYCDEFLVNWNNARQSNDKTASVSPAFTFTRLEHVQHALNQEQKKVKEMEKKSKKVEGGWWSDCVFFLYTKYGGMVV